MPAPTPWSVLLPSVNTCIVPCMVSWSIGIFIAGCSQFLTSIPSKFNHKFRECRGTETCPHCTGNHKLKDCTARPTEFKCTNCQNYNKYNKNANICENHSSLDKNCPSFQAVLERHRQYTDYWDGNQHTKTGNYNSHQIKCLQVKLKHSKAATANLMKLVEEDQIDIICIQVP